MLDLTPDPDPQSDSISRAFSSPMTSSKAFSPGMQQDGSREDDLSRREIYYAPLLRAALDGEPEEKHPLSDLAEAAGVGKWYAGRALTQLARDGRISRGIVYAEHGQPGASGQKAYWLTLPQRALATDYLHCLPRHGAVTPTDLLVARATEAAELLRSVEHDKDTLHEAVKKVRARVNSLRACARSLRMEKWRLDKKEESLKNEAEALAREMQLIRDLESEETRLAADADETRARVSSLRAHIRSLRVENRQLSKVENRLRKSSSELEPKAQAVRCAFLDHTSNPVATSEKLAFVLKLLDRPALAPLALLHAIADDYREALNTARGVDQPLPANRVHEPSR